MENKNIIIILVAVVIVLAVVAGAMFLQSGNAKEPCKIKITSDKEQYEGGELSIKLTDFNKTPISKEIVNITITNKKGKVVVDEVVKTDSKGKAKLDLDLKKGKYTVNVTYAGNDNYTGNNTTQKLTIKEEEVVESQPVQQSSSTSDDSNYYNGYSRSSFSEGEQAAIDDARAHGYDSPAAYYQATGKNAGQDYIDSHPRDMS
ncbi:Ig-like domain-containing protein [Methanobrevibacter sp.]|uniref:Ig-like domain-containing protein n=1 Tax=Methanobrevibacter sp. TaxID=66852 RepID=UPI00386CB8E9